jgi:hypothetical protein
MKINTLLNLSQRLLFVLALSILSLPLFAGSKQEAELDSLLALKRRGSPQSVLSGENGITQTIEGEYFVVSKGDLVIRMPLGFGLDNLREILDLLENGLKPAVLTGKWIVSNETSKYASFEFTHEGDYIIVERSLETAQDDPVIHFGNYQIQDKMLVLDDFADLTVTGLSDVEIEFDFSLGDYQESEVVVQKIQPYADTEQINLVCKTWKLIKRQEMETKNTEYEDTILFTKAGTYLVTYPNGDIGLAHWEWLDGEQKTFYYSWDNGETSGVVQIHELTSGSFIVEDEGQIKYEFIPLSDYR